MAEYISVSQLNRLSKQVLDSCEPLSSLIVLGELSGFVRNAKSGHCYFTLKDAAASVKGVMFRDKARLLGFAPQDGMQVLAYGRATIYEPNGSYQLYTEFMRPFGAGAAQMAFDALKAKLEKEGLLDPARKRPLPPMPRCIGLVTSGSGAALQDVRSVVERRWPLAKLLLAPATVQGAEAESSIVAAITALDADPRPDLILITRGGGGKEDLWVFNSERIARAAAACRRPVVSAVGHEIDYTILDYVADLRAPTPSAAAELCVPDIGQYRAWLAGAEQNFQKSIQSRLQLWYNKMSQISAHPALRDPQGAVRLRAAEIEKLSGAVQDAVTAKLKDRTRRLQNAAALAASLNPYGVLARGYTMVTDEAGTPRTVQELRAGQTVTVRDDRAWARCRVEKTGEQEHDDGKTEKL